MKKIILGLLLTLSVQAADQQTKYFEQARDCTAGNKQACTLIIDSCNQGTDWACAWHGYYLLEKKHQYLDARSWLAKGCDAGGKQSCDLLNFFPQQMLKACADGLPKACKVYKSL